MNSVSRGLHKARRWTAPAWAVKYHLEGKSLRVSPGAVVALEKFFRCVLAGVAFEEKRTLKIHTPLAASISALTIALRCHRQHQPYDLRAVKRTAKKHLRIMRRMRKKDTFVGTSAEKKSLDAFLSELIQQGEREWA